MLLYFFIAFFLLLSLGSFALLFVFFFRQDGKEAGPSVNELHGRHLSARNEIPRRQEIQEIFSSEVPPARSRLDDPHSNRRLQALSGRSTLNKVHPGARDRSEFSGSSENYSGINESILRKELELIGNQLYECEYRIRFFDETSTEMILLTGISKQASEALILAKRMVQSLEARLKEISNGLNCKEPRYDQLYHALTARLELPGDAVSTILTSNTIDSIAWNDVGKTFAEISSILDQAIQNLSKRKPSYG